MMLMPKLMVFGLVFAGLAIPAVAARTVRVMSYNIRMGAGSGKWVACPEGDPWHLPEVAKTITDAKADYIALQEVCRKSETGGHVDQTEYLKKQTGLAGEFMKKIPKGDGDYGLAVLGRTPPKAVRKIVLPHSDHHWDHTRIVQVADFGDFCLATTHFPLKKAACAEAARVVVRELAKGDKPVILCGDFNSLPDSEAVAELKKGFVLLSDPSKVTCPTEKPDQCIDYIFVDRAHAGRVKASGYTVGDSKASDHLPLWIDLEIAGVPGPAVTCPLTKATTEIQ